MNSEFKAHVNQNCAWTDVMNLLPTAGVNTLRFPHM